MLSRQPGSRLKTPALPIWISSCCGHFGVMFNSNRELLRNYHAEKRFELHYYTCAGNYMTMTIDNRSQFDNDAGQNNAGNSNVSRDDGTSSLISRLIHTKWADAKITIKGAPSTSLLMWIRRITNFNNREWNLNLTKNKVNWTHSFAHRHLTFLSIFVCIHSWICAQE